MLADKQSPSLGNALASHKAVTIFEKQHNFQQFLNSAMDTPHSFEETS
jgi:hypothetical protein